MVCSTFFNFFSFNLRNYIFQSTKKCEMTSFYMTLLNEAAKCVYIIPLTSLASFSRRQTLDEVQNGDDLWPNSRRFITSFMKVGGINLDRTRNWCSAVGKVAF